MPHADRRLFVLDTNVLLHDPTALFRFREHDVYLPMVVLEELDRGKKGVSETARNARQSSRLIDELISRPRTESIHQGLSLAASPMALAEGNGRAVAAAPSGQLFFEVRSHRDALPGALPGDRPDNSILATTLALMGEHPEYRVTLVSKDINLRIKAQVIGIQAEDYHNDQVLEDADLLYAGTRALPGDFWTHQVEAAESWQDDQRTFHRIEDAAAAEWTVNECLYSEAGAAGFDAIVRERGGEGAVIERARAFYSERQSVWGIQALNREQNFALNLLTDPNIEFVTLVGQAGTGKTLLTLAAGLEQTLEEQRYSEIIMTRVTVPVGDDIGYLPGTEEEKMAPWMGALMDNLEVLTASGDGPGGSWERQATHDLLANRIKLRSINFMRGRTFLNRYLILDEAQNLTPKQMKTLITRAGPGTKIVCLGNIAQIDSPYLSETNCGLTYVVDRFKGWQHAGHIILTRGERSRLADYASEVL